MHESPAKNAPGPKVAIAVQMRYSSPWSEIFDQGQMATWVKLALKQKFHVVRLESQRSGVFLDFVDAFWDTRRHGRYFGPLVRKVLRILDVMLPFHRPRWGVEPAKVPVIREYSPGLLLLHHRRNMALFEWFLSQRSEQFLYRTNSSSYVVADRLNLTLGKLDPDEPIIGGYHDVDGFGREFVSGAGILMSRKGVELLYGMRNEIRRDIAEDVAISLLARKAGLRFIELPRWDLRSPSEELEEVQNNSEIFHIRCKAEPRPDGDVAVMKRVHQALYEN